MKMTETCEPGDDTLGQVLLRWMGAPWMNMCIHCTQAACQSGQAGCRRHGRPGKAGQRIDVRLTEVRALLCLC